VRLSPLRTSQTLDARLIIDPLTVQPLIRALSQALCNLLTGNEILTKELLPAYVRNPFDSNLIM
jgi:hypothetical protein